METKLKKVRDHLEQEGKGNHKLNELINKIDTLSGDKKKDYEEKLINIIQKKYPTINLD
jgi:hypothetical protein